MGTCKSIDRTSSLIKKRKTNKANEIIQKNESF